MAEGRFAPWLKWTAAAVGLLVVGGGTWAWLQVRSMGSVEYWESDIAAFEEADRQAAPAPGQVLFVGSSSIVMWDELDRDMAPLAVLNRGFGGSHIAHVNHYANRIILPYAPRAVVLYAGDNDLAEGTGKTPESVFEDFRRFVAIARSQQPSPPVYFIAIKPSRLRWDRWPEMSRANRLIADFAAAHEGVHYLDIATPMLSEGGGEPDASLFLFDGLHLSEKGYALWTSVVHPVLMRDLSADRL